MKIKRERDEMLGDNAIDLTQPTPKRQRKETNSKTATISSATTRANIPDELREIYQQLLPNSPNGIAFLFSPDFSTALNVPAERAASSYGVTKEQAIEELHRLLALKAFMADHDATKISPTPLSTMNLPSPLSLQTNLRN